MSGALSSAGACEPSTAPPPLVFAAVASEGADPPIFAMDVTAADGGTVVSAEGELDLANAEAFTRAVAEALATGPVTLDLSAVEFMDSSGVRAINDAVREAAQLGNELRVRPALQPGVVQVLELTGMMRVLPIEDGA